MANVLPFVNLKHWKLMRREIDPFPDVWCWARIAASVVNLYGFDTRESTSPCRVVERVKQKPADTCCSPSTSGSCHLRGTTEIALCGHKATVECSSDLNSLFLRIYQEILGNRPVILRGIPQGKSSHVVAVIGAGIVDGKELMRIEDPDDNGVGGACSVLEFSCTFSLDTVLFTKQKTGSGSWWSDVCLQVSPMVCQQPLGGSPLLDIVDRKWSSESVREELAKNSRLIRFEKGLRSESDMEFGSEIEVWSASIDRLGKPRPVGWFVKLLVRKGTRMVKDGGVSLLRSFDDKSIHYTGLYSAQFEKAIENADSLLVGMDPAHDGRFRRLLRIPEAYFIALWVSTREGDRFIPLPPTSFPQLDNGSEGILPLKVLKQEQLVARMESIRSMLAGMSPL